MSKSARGESTRCAGTVDGHSRQETPIDTRRIPPVRSTPKAALFETSIAIHCRMARTARHRALISWSSGKDSAWALQVVRERGDLEPVGLLTTCDEASGRVSMQGVRRELVEAQSAATGLPVWWVALPWPCPNEEYERRMAGVVEEALAHDIDRMVFGDLFLEDVRAYRVGKLRGSGAEPVFPIWCGRGGTLEVARRMISSGLRAVVTSVDPSQLDSSFAGREFGSDFLAELPPDVDPLGERGEFHTFCYAGPMFDDPIRFGRGGVSEVGAFTRADLISTAGSE